MHWDTFADYEHENAPWFLYRLKQQLHLTIMWLTKHTHQESFISSEKLTCCRLDSRVKVLAGNFEFTSISRLFGANSTSHPKVAISVILRPTPSHLHVKVFRKWVNFTAPVQLSSTSSCSTSYHDSNTHHMTTIHNKQCWLSVHFSSLLYFPANHIPPCSQVLLEKLVTPHLVMKFPAFYRTLRLIITVFITPHNWSITIAR